MTGKSFQDPYRAVIEQLNRLGIRYVVVGMMGINYYAKNPAEAFATMDYDVFLEPAFKNVEKAVKSLQALGFQLGTQDGSLKAADFSRIIRLQKTIVATTSEGLMVELLLKVSGFPFSEMAKDAVTFSVEGVPIRVGRLEKLLRSKHLAGREKDRSFLKRYRLLLKEPSKKRNQSKK